MLMAIIIVSLFALLLLADSFPETVPDEFVDQVVTAANKSKNGHITIEEMTVMLRNLHSIQPITREEVKLIMERDLGLDPSTEDSVPIEKVKELLLEIDN